ncbi:hypothetical protein EXIGLDRAFT_767597 [Exidia glandulosa HHB12029]|uniref:Uncharacterized protein n=1 Tax=Exidia glandulosa HHB12029 TaxID=1314781 RepID=A0A165IVK8_EXIGL|nr:hypothetical protein EXIGLDRAFT_767597 [Exidia glandulosa HHB12029]
MDTSHDNPFPAAIDGDPPGYRDRSPLEVIDVDALVDDNNQGREVIDVDALDEPVNLRIVCEHWWKANPVREDGSATRETRVQVPYSIDNTFNLSDITPAARRALLLSGFTRDRLWVFRAGVDPHPAFDDPDAGEDREFFEWEDRASNSAVVSFKIKLSGHEIALHTTLTAEELFVDRDWRTLGLLRLFVTVIHRHEVMEFAICYVRRRRIAINDCTVRLRDFSANDLERLGLLAVPLERISDGSNREITYTTRLWVTHREEEHDENEGTLRLWVR